MAATKDTLYVADTNNQRVRSFDLKSKDDTVETVVGTGKAGFSGDGASPLDAQIHAPGDLATTGSGDLYIADVLNQRIRFVDFDKKKDAIITTVAGNGSAGFSGDDGPPTSASLNYPWGITVADGSTFTIADTRNNRIRSVNKGKITTIAGTGVNGYSGDGGPALDAKLSFPFGISYDRETDNRGDKEYLFADSGNHAVRELDDKLGDAALAPAAPAPAGENSVSPPWPPAG